MKSGEEIGSDSKNLGVKLGGSRHGGSPRQKDDSLCSLRKETHTWWQNYWEASWYVVDLIECIFINLRKKKKSSFRDISVVSLFRKYKSVKSIETVKVWLSALNCLFTVMHYIFVFKLAAKNHDFWHIVSNRRKCRQMNKWWNKHLDFVLKEEKHLPTFQAICFWQNPAHTKVKKVTA